MLEQIFKLLAGPEGSLVFHLLISFSLISILHPALGFSLSEMTTKSKRVFFGLLLLIISRMLIFVVSGLAFQGIGNFDLYLPVIDRLVNAISITMIIWLWVYQEPDRIGDIGVLAFSMVILVGGTISMILWSSQGELNTFNDSNFALAWSIFSVLLLLGGELLLMRKEVEDRNLGLTMLFIIFLGEAIQMILRDTNSDFPSVVRLSFIAAFPLMLGMTKRFIKPEIIVEQRTLPFINQIQEETEKKKGSELSNEKGSVQRGIDLKLFQTTLALASVSDYQEISQLLTMYVANALVSDIALLLSPPDENEQVRIICGYDLITQESLDSVTFDSRLIPGFLNAAERGKPLQIPAKNASNMLPFADLLHLDEIGNLLAYPIINNEMEVLAVIVLISPYSKYVWAAKDQAYLKEAVGLISNVLQRNDSSGNHLGIVDQLTEKLNSAEAEVEIIRQEKEALTAELAVLAVQEVDQDKSSEEIENLLKNQESTNATLEILEQENYNLKTSLDQLKQINQELSAEKPNPDIEKFQTKLNQSLEQISFLQNQLNAANQKAIEIDNKAKGNGDSLSTEQAEVIASIAQELRQPMSSISGYTDLLINESVGILGALQRKFLERVKASTGRMNHLIGDLIQITALDSGSVAFTPQPIELVDAIDEALEHTSAQFREKNLVLRVDLAPNLPKMQSDKDSLHQIILHLLQNAGAASPIEGEIFLKAEISDNTDEDIIRIEVTDSGEGISKEDLPRVFSRLYRADNPLIQGVGDTGVGLSIAKTLTEALGGRIWVESIQGIGSTFSLLLPVTTQIAEAVGE